MKQKEEGITLITLVVMIVLTIIIAGVAVYSVTKNDMITEVKQDMQYQYEASVNEAVKMNSTIRNQYDDWGL